MEILMNLPVSWRNHSFTYQQLSYAGADLLTDLQVDKHHIARQILCIVCNLDKIRLITDTDTFVSDTDVEKYYSYMMRFHNNEPLSRLEGIKSFYGFDFEISEYTLDPRPETEIIIDLLQKNYPCHDDNLVMIDIGTGTGCLAITAARIYVHSRITALDICKNTIIIANRNAERADVQSRIDFILIKENPNEIEANSYDVILCNPPYIPQTAKEYLDLSVKDFDPEVALFYGDDGLGFYHILAEFGVKNLKANGVILVEFGIGQAKCVKEIFSNKMFGNFLAVKDNNGIIRAAQIKF